MTKFDEQELAAMRECQEAAMQDECVIQRWRGLPDSLGEMVGEWEPDPAPTPCGFGWSERVEIKDGAKTLVRGEYRVRLPHGTTVDARDRLTITARFGAPESDPQTYEIDGEPAVGVSGLVLRLKKVTT